MNLKNLVTKKGFYQYLMSAFLVLPMISPTYHFVSQLYTDHRSDVKLAHMFNHKCVLFFRCLQSSYGLFAIASSSACSASNHFSRVFYRRGVVLAQ